MAVLSTWSVHRLERLVELVAQRRALGMQIRDTYAWIAYVALEKLAAGDRLSLWQRRLRRALADPLPDEFIVSAREQRAAAIVFLDKLEETCWDLQTKLLALTDEFANCQAALLRAWRDNRSKVPGPPIEPIPIFALEEDHRRVAETVRRGRFSNADAGGAQSRREAAENLWRLLELEAGKDA